MLLTYIIVVKPFVEKRCTNYDEEKKEYTGFCDYRNTVRTIKDEIKRNKYEKIEYSFLGY